MKKSIKEKQKKTTLDIHPPVFLISAGLILLFVVISLVELKTAREVFNELQATLARNAGWFYILTVNVLLLFALILPFTRFGNIRLGGKDAKPDFKWLSWFSMLFSAGMGIGLLFWSVAEPLHHYSDPPVGQAHTTEAAKLGLRLTYFHWGLHAWGIYATVSLALAFFSFNKGLPLTIRSAFYPVLGDRIYGPVGNLIDILAVVATLFGVATSLGLGVQQVNAGLHFLLGFAQSTLVQVLLIAGITSVATISVVLGLDRGIRRISEFNMSLAGLLLLFVFLVGPTLFILEGVIQNTGAYLHHILPMSTWTEAYAQTQWQHNWTVFYWGWWIAWSPFVGMFIARISRGRTVREFLLGVLLVPTLLTFLWLAVFGNSALHEEMFGQGGLAGLVKENLPIALFQLLQFYPFAMVTSTIAVIVVTTFFVTSSDSGSLVIDIITAGGNPNPPVQQRVFWAVLEGVVAAVLLVGGGLTALQTASITFGLPFAIVLLFLCYSLHKGLGQYYRETMGQEYPQYLSPAPQNEPEAAQGRGNFNPVASTSQQDPPPVSGKDSTKGDVS